MVMMGKGRFLNQKLGKRMSRKYGLIKTQIGARTLKPQSKPDLRLPKKGHSRETQPPSS
jgi:hypothetical protein